MAKEDADLQLLAPAGFEWDDDESRTNLGSVEIHLELMTAAAR